MPIGKEAILAAARIGGRYLVETDEAPRFRRGDRVQTSSFNPSHHTRLPAYAKGKVGTIDRHQGCFVFPDTNAHGQGEQPQHVYSVRFEGQELWGDDHQGADAVYLDMWDSYLAPAER